MKLTAILLLVAALQVSATGYGQRVTLSLKNATLEKAITEIEKQTGYSFVYGKEQLAQAKSIDISVTNEKLETVLDQVFKGLPLTYTISGKYIAIKQTVSVVTPFGTPNDESPPIDVKGRVLNDKGQPVEGAIVTVKGTSKRVTTDANGNFSIKQVNDDAILIITSVNIETFEIKVSDKADFVVNVKSKVTTVAEVIVEANTGYQKVKPNEVNGSIVVVTKDMLNQQIGTNIIDRLNGVTSGMLFNVGKSGNNPNKTNPYSIRGLSTIEGPVEPLIVLDNFPFEGDINSINPDDVESITVLKDAAATSIYGARGGNGVIVITTKKSRYNQKLSVDFNSVVRITDKPNFGSLPVMTVEEYIDVEQRLFNQGLFDNRINATPYLALTPGIEILLQRRKGQISSQDSAMLINSLKGLSTYRSALKEFYRKPLTHQSSISIRGGSSNIAWLLSASYSNTISNLDAQNANSTVQFSNAYKPFKNFEIRTSVYYSLSTSKSGMANPIGIGYRDAPYLKFADEYGNALPIPIKYRTAYTDTAGNGQLLDWRYYPLENNMHDITKNRTDQLVANFGLKYDILKALNFTFDYQYQKIWGEYDRLANIESYFTRDLINSFTNLNYPTSNSDLRYPVPLGSIRNTGNSKSNSFSLRPQVNLNASWSRHSLSAFVGFECRQVVNFGGNGLVLYGYSENPLSYASNLDYKTLFPDYITKAQRTIPTSISLNNKTTSRFASLFGNISYSWKQRYTLSGSLRKDASNIFGLSTNDKWNPLWSSGLGWEASKEPFYKSKKVRYLKFRLTLGFSGNVDNSKTAVPILNIGTNTFINSPSGTIVGINNPELRWEKSRQINFGTSFTIGDQLINGSIDIYFKRGIDLYGQTPHDYTTYGLAPTVVKNVANMRGKGLDVDLNFNVLRKRLKWEIKWLLNYNQSRTSEYFSSSAQTVKTIIADGNTIKPVVGKPLYAIAAYRWGGLDSLGNPQGFLNGQLSTDYRQISQQAGIGYNSDNIVYVGPSNPTLFGSVINSLHYKGLGLSFNVAYKFGYYFRKPVLLNNQLVQNGVGHSDYTKRWQKPGDEFVTNVPSFLYPAPSGMNLNDRDAFYQASEINVLRADNIRLQYINLSYLIPFKNGKIPFKQVQLYCNISNVCPLWFANKEGIDPEYEGSIYPSRSYSFGFRISAK